MDVLKPFVLLACVAFVLGFTGYLAVAKMTSVTAAAPAESWSSTVSAPASDYANRGKLI